MRLLITAVLTVAVLCTGAAFTIALTPAKVEPGVYVQTEETDLANGGQLFWAGGCASCHAAPGATGNDQLMLSGGLAIVSDFGTFHAPNISPHPQAGIGGWSLEDFANAVTKGIGRHGENLYPSLPYTSYTRMSEDDVRDLFGFIETLPESDTPSRPNEIAFPFNIRPALSFWKLLYLKDSPRVEIESATPEILRGQYLVEGPGHCGECHTPRNRIGGPEYGKWLAGGPNPDGPGMIPDITPGSDKIGSWTASEIADYLETGFTPDFDVAGGSMVEVQQNLAHLPRADLEAIGAYLKAIPAQ